MLILYIQYSTCRNTRIAVYYWRLFRYFQYSFPWIYFPVNDRFEKESFMEIMSQQAGKGPLSAILLHRNADGVMDHVDSSVEIALQELSGDTFYIVRYDSCVLFHN